MKLEGGDFNYTLYLWVCQNKETCGLYYEGANSKSKCLDSIFIKVLDFAPLTAVVAVLIYFLTKDS